MGERQAKTELTARQQQFVSEYMIDFNGTQAAIRAGYNYDGASQTGSVLLANPKVAAAVAAAKAERALRNEALAQRVLDELAAIAFSNIGDLVDISAGTFRIRQGEDVPEVVQRAISSIKVKREKTESGDVDVVEFKLWDKVAALTKLAQHLGILEQASVKIENNNTNAVQLNWDQLYLPGEPTSAGLERQIEEAETPKAIKDQGGDDA